MRWFKHLSSSSENETMAELIQEFGAEGYGVWWIIVEKIAGLMDKSNRCFARYSMNFWRTFTKTSPKKLQNILTFLEKNKIFSLKFEKNYLTIECPKLLFYRDEYTEKAPKKNEKVSGHCRDKYRDTVGTNIGRDSPPEAETETDTKADKKTPPTPSPEARERNLKKQDDIKTIFEHWQKIMSHEGAKLSVERRKIISNGLAMGYTSEQLCEAIIGCSLSPFHMGQNDRGETYDGLKLIFRSADQIDKFLKYAKNPPRALNKTEKLFEGNLSVAKSWAERKKQEAKNGQ